MDLCQVTIFILLGAILGSTGQCLRVIVGLKKCSDNVEKDCKLKDWFDSKQLLVSLIIGSVAGIIGAVTLLGEPVDKQLLITLITIGYAGTDFIEGFMKKKLPH